HGKSTFINALLGAPLLPTGITPTTALLTHISHGAKTSATAVTDGGERRKLETSALGEWVTVEGVAQPKPGGKGKGKGTTAGTTGGDDPIHHVEITMQAPLLENHLSIVDTPGVNDINEQRAEITYGYLPRADAAIFLLDATQILTASERQFLEE